MLEASANVNKDKMEATNQIIYKIDIQLEDLNQVFLQYHLAIGGAGPNSASTLTVHIEMIVLILIGSILLSHLCLNHLQSKEANIVRPTVSIAAIIRVLSEITVYFKTVFSSFV